MNAKAAEELLAVGIITPKRVFRPMATLGSSKWYST